MYYFRDYLQIKEEKLIYIPLLKKGRIRLNIEDYVNQNIVTASCMSVVYKINDNYKYKYIDVIPEILKITKGKHIHIGAIEPSQESFIRNKIKEYNLEDKSFCIIRHTDHLAKFLLDNNVDIFIDTFPVGGGLAKVEAMQAGKKIILHKNMYSYLYNAIDRLYDNVFSWEKPEDLYEHLSNVNYINIKKEGEISRQFYDKYCSDYEKYIKSNEIIGEECDIDKTRIQYSYALDNYGINLTQTRYINFIKNTTLSMSSIKSIIKKIIKK